MKLQYLAVIFVIIIMPMIIVFSEYMNTQIGIIKTEQIYDAKLFDSTHDAINAFKINTINSTYYAPQSRVRNIEASVKTFYNSLLTSFQDEGNLAISMKSYVPAVVFTMYDGYYIYSPFTNILTGVDDKDEDNDGIGDKVDDEYKNGKIIDGLKPFVSYSCRYEYNNKKYIITYSMDNYIFVDVFDKVSNKHQSKGGYLINGIQKVGDSYKYDGITFNKNDTESLKEKIIGANSKDIYYYTLFDGTKYYYYNSLKDNGEKPAGQPNDDDYIFYIDEQRERHKQVVSKKNNETEFMEYYNRIFNNNYAYLYYKESYEFTKWLLEGGIEVDIDGDGTKDAGQNLQNLTINNIVQSENYSGYDFADVGSIFDSTTSKIQYSNSNFNRHRSDVIRAIITTNLSKAITGYKLYSKTTGVSFLMPKISDTDWELLENNICIVAFMQGINVKGSDKRYNSYCVIPNNFNKEFVDENDIYILTTDTTYTRTNDNTIKDGTKIIQNKNELGFEPGLLRMDFETREDKDGEFYNPITLNGNLYLESYTNIAGASEINGIEKIDMYRYVEDYCSDRLKKVYYTALGRERYGSFKYTINEI